MIQAQVHSCLPWAWGWGVVSIYCAKSWNWSEITATDCTSLVLEVTSLLLLLLSRFSCVRLLATHGLQPTRLLHPWDFPGKSTGVGCHCLLLQAVSGPQSSKILIAESDRFCSFQVDSLPLSHMGSPVFSKCFLLKIHYWLTISIKDKVLWSLTIVNAHLVSLISFFLFLFL